jgi:hypothetical protein
MNAYPLLRTILLMLALAGPAGAQARFDQRPSPAYALFRAAPPPPPAHPASFISRAPDYRWEGLAIGAIAGGLLFGIASRSLCDGGGSCIAGTLYFAALGAVPAGLFGCFVGMFIPKHHSASTH